MGRRSSNLAVMTGHKNFPTPFLDLEPAKHEAEKENNHFNQINPR